MGKKIPRSYFETNEVLFVGYSKKTESFCKMVADAFEKRGAKVYPVNPDPSRFDLTVYPDIASVPGTPSFAYVLTASRHNVDVVKALVQRGIKKVAFQSKMSADATTLEHCARLGLEAVVACPMMALGGGFHRFHGWLAGVR